MKLQAQRDPRYPLLLCRYHYPRDEQQVQLDDLEHVYDDLEQLGLGGYIARRSLRIVGG